MRMMIIMIQGIGEVDSLEIKAEGMVIMMITMIVTEGVLIQEEDLEV
jgi:hypothetical protein